MLRLIPDPPSRHHLPFDRFTALRKVEGLFDRPFDKLTVLSKVEGLPNASSFVIAAYW